MVGLLVARTQRGAALLMFAALLVACSGADTEPPTTAPPTTLPRTTSTTTTSPPPAAPTTTSATTTTTTVDPLARPEKLVSNPNRDSIDDFDTSADDPYIVMVELKDLFVFLEGNPSGTAEEMVKLVFEDSYPYWDPILVGFRELTENPGWRYIDSGVQTLGIELVEATQDIAILRVADQRSEQIVADDDGQVVKTYDGWDRKVTTVTIRRGDDGRWRLTDLEPSAPITDDELSTMVPVEWTGRKA